MDRREGTHVQIKPRPRMSSHTLDVYTDPERESLWTWPNGVTAVRTVASVVIAAIAAGAQSLALLIIALAVYWVGDMADGLLARVTHAETRIGAVLDIMSDRFCAAFFYVGLAWLIPALAVPVAVYLAEFMVIDAFISIGFLAWSVRSPNYFYIIDHRLWRWNWSKPAKAVNSGLFAVLLIVIQWWWVTIAVVVGTAIAVALLVFKTVSLVRMARIGLPIPPRDGDPVSVDEAACSS